MVNIGLVEIKSKVVEKERKRPSYSSSLNSYGFMSLITIDSPKYVETDVDVVTGKIYKGRYNIDTDYGSSDSPIFIPNFLIVVGIHKQGDKYKL